MPVVLAFHKVFSGFTFGSTNFPPRRLERLLELLTGSGLRFGDAAFLEDGPGERRVALTFDDGYAHLADILPPLMERFSFRPMVFIPSAFIGRRNRWDYSYVLRPFRHLDRGAIRQLADAGVRFGSHGHSHADLTALDDTRLGSELLFSRASIEDIIGRKVTAISYPFGRCNARVARAASATGFETGFTTRFPKADDSALARGRLPIYGYDTPLSVWQKVTAGRLYKVERLKTQATTRLSGGTMWLNRLRRVP
jgi:peptidoglycan/xylan/chitin deacetylase (PgdA/CDA1 family)